MRIVLEIKYKLPLQIHALNNSEVIIDERILNINDTLLNYWKP
jgi:hypothetical protein